VSKIIRITTGAGDLSDSDNEVEDEREEEVVAKDAVNEHLIKDITRMGAKEKMDIPFYEGNLDVEELLDWIRAIDTYFNYEDVEEDKKVKHVFTRLKGHATLWWDELQVDRRCKGKQKIKSSNDCKDEGKVHPKRLSNHSVQEDIEPETEADDS
jgi:hypothetical protein